MAVGHNIFTAIIITQHCNIYDCLTLVVVFYLESQSFLSGLRREMRSELENITVSIYSHSASNVKTVNDFVICNRGNNHLVSHGKLRNFQIVLAYREWYTS